MWNSLPNNVILADNVNQFKNRLHKRWKMHDIVFNYRADFAETGSSNCLSLSGYLKFPIPCIIF